MSAIICATIISLQSCKFERGKDNTRFNITGRLLKDCNGEPLANQKLKFTHTNWNGKEFTDSVGVGTSDASGYFSIPATFQGTGNWSLVNEGVWEYPVFIGSAKDEKVELGNIYTTVTYTGKLKVNVSGIYGASDTLFIQTSNNNSPSNLNTYIYPVEAKTYELSFTFDRTGAEAPYVDGTSSNLWWGIGTSDVKAANREGSDQLVRMKYDICGRPVPETMINVSK